MDDKTAQAWPLLAVAHGTRNPAGIEANAALIELVRKQRPDVDVSLCWLDIAEPSLTSALPEIGAAVAVPVLLSTGYHVTKDIPDALQARPDVLQAGHLGPDRLVLEAVADLLRGAGSPTGRRTALIGSGSSDPAARTELIRAGEILAELIDAEVVVGQLTDDHPLADAGPDDHIASYLLAPGYFADRLRALAGSRLVSAPIGAHPAIATLIWQRYDEALAGDRLQPTDTRGLEQISAQVETG